MRITSFIILFLIALSVPLAWFLPFLALYLIVWTGYEVFILGVVIDSMFGIGLFSYMYTLSVGVCMVCIELIRPYMSWYDTDTRNI